MDPTVHAIAIADAGRARLEKKAFVNASPAR